MCAMKKLLLIIWLTLQCAHALAAAQDHQELRNSVIAFVQQQTATLPGRAIYQVDEIDRRIILPQCSKLEVFLPTGSHLIGKTSVGVRCSGSNGWSVFVPVQIKISLDLLISARQLPPGLTLRHEDISTQTTEITQAGGITDPKQVTGKVLRYGIAAGQILREEMLRPPYSVTQGQTIQLVIQGSRFSIRSAGIALNNASEGQPVKVRNDAGVVVSGMARADGVVEIAP